MNRKFTIIFSVVMLIVIAITQLGLKPTTIPANRNIQTASFLTLGSVTDTFDFNTDELEKEMEKLKEELEVLKDREFHFDFDNEDFHVQMEKLKKELSELDLEDFNFEYDDTELKNNMDKLEKELSAQNFSFHFDMDNFKEEMRELKKELKQLDINFDDFGDEFNKLNEFMNDLRIELKSDGLINDVEEEFDLELNKDEMIVNSNVVSNELFVKYKNMYEEYFGKKLDGEHKLRIRRD